MPFASPLVERLDHLMIEVDDPTWLFELFNRRLGLPVAWQLEEAEGVVSGGVWAGNLALAFVRFKGLRFGQLPSRPVAAPGTARYTGLALEAARPLPDILQAMHWRGLSTGFVDEGPHGTLATLPGLLTPPEMVYNVSRRRGAEAAEGSVFGLRGVREVEVDSPSPEAWARLLMPTQPVGDGYPLGGGVRLVIRGAEAGAIAAVTLETTSLSRAREALAELGLLGEATPDRLTIAPEPLGGLRLYVRGPA